MSKFDAIRASGDMMPTAMGTPALDGKKIFEKFFNNSFYSLDRRFVGGKISLTYSYYFSLREYF